MAIDPKRLASRFVGAVLLGTAAYYAVWGGEYSVFDLYRLDRRHAEEQERLAAVRAEVDSLRPVAARLQDDPLTLETVAREQFGMIRDGEILYRFVTVEPAPETAANP